MELRHLRSFAAVAETGAFSRAAGKLGLTQPALWRQVQVLETELGVRLFERVGRRVQLTSEGDDLLRRSRDLLAAADQLGEHAQALRGGGTGILRVGASPQVIQSVVAPFLARYLKSRPRVEVHLLEEGALRLPSLVQRGEAHLALMDQQSGESFERRPLFPVRVLAAVSLAHRLRRQAVVDISDLRNESLLLLRPGFWTREIFDGACRLGHLRPNIALEAGDPQSLIALAEAGRGVAIVPSTVVFAARKVRAAPLLHAGASLGTWLSLAWERRRFMPAYARSFADELVDYTRRRYPGRELDRRAPRLPILEQTRQTANRA